MAQSSVLDAPYDAGKGRRPSARHRAATVAAGAVAALGVCAGVIVVMQLRAGGAAGARTSAFAFRRQPQLALDPELHLAAQQPPAAAAAAAAAAPHPPALGGVAFTVVVPPVVAPYGEREKAVELLWSSEAGASGSNPFYHHGPNDPLVEEVEQLLPAGDFESLKAALSAHPLRHRSNGINDVTSGWSMVFTADGLAKMCGSPLFQAVCPYFDKIRLPRANAWVMNILVIKPGQHDEEADADNGAAGAHVDDGLAMLLQDQPWPVYAHQTDVLYVQVPADRVGGDLEVWPLGVDPDTDDDADATVTRVRVRENKAVRFRSDATHRVRRHQSASGAERISLVTEQYIIPDKYLSHIPSLYMMGQETLNDDLLPFIQAGDLPLDLNLKVLPERTEGGGGKYGY